MLRVDQLIEIQCIIFLLIACGYVLAKAGVLPPSSDKLLSDFLINFVLPCNIIVSFMMEFSREIFMACLQIFAISCGVQLVTYVSGRLFFSRQPREKRASLQYSTMISNAAFIGTPIVEQLYGATGTLYCSIYLIPSRIVMWSLGLSFYTGKRGKGVLKKVLTHPCIVSVVIGIVLMAFQLPLPAVLSKSLRYVGSMVTPLSLITVGVILSGVDLRTVFEPLVLRFCAVRLLLIPALALIACTLMRIELVAGGTAVLLAGMPAGSTAALLAAKYDCDAGFAAKLVCASTLLSMATLPLLCLCRQWLFTMFA